MEPIPNPRFIARSVSLPVEVVPGLERLGRQLGAEEGHPPIPLDEIFRRVIFVGLSRIVRQAKKHHEPVTCTPPTQGNDDSAHTVHLTSEIDDALRRLGPEPAYLLRRAVLVGRDHLSKTLQTRKNRDQAVREEAARYSRERYERLTRLTPDGDHSPIEAPEWLIPPDDPSPPPSPDAGT